MEQSSLTFFLTNFWSSAQINWGDTVGVGESGSAVHFQKSTNFGVTFEYKNLVVTHNTLPLSIFTSLFFYVGFELFPLIIFSTFFCFFFHSCYYLIFKFSSSSYDFKKGGGYVNSAILISLPYYFEPVYAHGMCVIINKKCVDIGSNGVDGWDDEMAPKFIFGLSMKWWICYTIYICVLWQSLMGGWLFHYSLKCQPVDYSDDPIAIRVSSAFCVSHIALSFSPSLLTFFCCFFFAPFIDYTLNSPLLSICPPHTTRNASST